MYVKNQHIAGSDGTKIYYEVCSAGDTAPVALLVHGIGGDVDAWQQVRDMLMVQGISTIALDLRGHGYSDHPRALDAYTMDLIAEDIACVIEAEGLQKVALVGHSGGAVIALHFALAYPELLDSLVLIAGSYKEPAYMRSSVGKAVANALVAIGALISPPHFTPWHSTYPPDKFHHEYEAYGLMRTIARNSLRSYLLVGKALVSVRLEERLAEVRVPTLLIAGDRDTIYPLSISQAMHERIPVSELAVIEGGNHVLPLNNAAETAQIAGGFIRARSVQ